MSNPVTYDIPKKLIKAFESFGNITENKQYALYHVNKLSNLIPSLDSPRRAISKLLKMLSKSLCILSNPGIDLFDEDIGECYMADPLAQMLIHKGSTISESIEELTVSSEDIEITIEFSNCKESSNLVLDLEVIQLAACSKGRIDLYFLSYIVQQLLKRKAYKTKKKYEELLNETPSLTKFNRLGNDLQKVIPNITQQIYTKKRYEETISIMVRGIQDEIIKETGHLNSYLFYNQFSQNNSSLELLEKLFIQLLGHKEPSIRDYAVKYLNALYDGVDWECKEALIPTITRVNESFMIRATIEKCANPSNILLVLNSPFVESSVADTHITYHNVKIIAQNENSLKLEVNLNKFWRCGFYDWRFIYLHETGVMEYCKNSDSSKCVIAQGRFIAQPEKLMEQQFHELMVDYAGVDGTPKNFKTLEKEINMYSSKSVTSLYVSGCLERDNGYGKDTIPMVKRKDANPFGVINRTKVCNMLGGDSKFKKVVSTSKRLGINIIVDAFARISSSRMDRKYKNLLLHYLDSNGSICLHYGTEGRSTKYENTALLNYRKKEAWDLLVEDILQFAKAYSVQGIYMDNGQSWPQVLDINEEEMYRIDSDGEHAYTNEEILDGSIITLNEFNGYWGSSAVDSFANPLYIKLAKTLWLHLPEFMIIAECYGGDGYESRQCLISRSGIIPRIFTLPPALSATQGKLLKKDGTIKNCLKKEVDSLIESYDNAHMFLPEGAILIQSSASYASPFPAQIYMRASWVAVDILMFLPDIPMTFMNEMEGIVAGKGIADIYMGKSTSSAHNAIKPASSQIRIAMDKRENSNEVPPHSSIIVVSEEKERHILVRSSSQSMLSSVSEIKAKQQEIVQETGPNYGFDLNKIVHHYVHRKNLRKSKKCLKYGKLVNLETKAAHPFNNKVYAFARITNDQIAIITTNISDSKVKFSLDLTALKEHLSKEMKESTFLIAEEWLTDSHPEYFFVDELFTECRKYELSAYQSKCLGVCLSESHDMSTISKAVSNVLRRFEFKFYVSNEVLDNTLASELLLKSLKTKSMNEFVMSLLTLHSLMLSKVNCSLDSILWKLDALKGNSETSAKILARIYHILETGKDDQNIQKMLPYQMAKQVSDRNAMHQIVFAAPELGRWSTVGGLGVMVDELTQGLAQMGEDVWVISPYYNFNKKKETGYLEKDPAGIKYVRNIVVQLDTTYTLGVHYGEVNGVKVVFLHNSDLFPVPYQDGSAVLIIKQLSVFAKGCLEYLCTQHIFPSVVVTNDWFAGLIPAYAKCNHFGTVFNNTSFFHIIHNLEPTYEGRLFSDTNLEYIHKLPSNLFIDPYWNNPKIQNPSRCVLMTCDQWCTVSKAYRQELLDTSPLNHLLRQKSEPFAFSNGIPVEARLKKIKDAVGTDHFEAKKKLQIKYFKYQDLDDSVPVLSFVGRVTEQKGVHFIVETAEQLIIEYGQKINILVGGMANPKEPYGAKCIQYMNYLVSKYPHSFWASPSEFFYDGALVNLGSDFGVMPSKFEPGGIVQHEYFVASTPVIAFKTGGLKDTVFESIKNSVVGNGCTFECYRKEEYMAAIRRGLSLFNQKDKYTICRANARKSVIDTKVVCAAWDNEFRRIKGKIMADKSIINDVQLEKWQPEIANEEAVGKYIFDLFKIKGVEYSKEFLSEIKRKAYECEMEVTFAYYPVHYCREVLIAGTFNSWARTLMEHNEKNNSWTYTKKLPTGQYEYYF